MLQRREDTDSGSGRHYSRLHYCYCNVVSYQIEYKIRGVQYHPSVPGRTQSNPMGRLRFKLGPRSPSRPPWVPSNRPVKGVEVVQHVELPELTWQFGGVYCLRSGATEAVTLLAKAMAVTKETRDL
jgi:hypothetical protein